MIKIAKVSRCIVISCCSLSSYQAAASNSRAFLQTRSFWVVHLFGPYTVPISHLAASESGNDTSVFEALA
jgi:hypothetical protein